MTLPKPRKLRADNFTPPARTPWGGRRIRAHYKSELTLPPGDSIVGESWEISVESSFPSLLEDGSSMGAAIATAPVDWLGAEDVGRYGGSLALLVKLLDAADNLSVQVHPEDGDPALAEDESGKPEAWVVLDAEPGAGLYLGFRDGVDQGQVERCLDVGGALDALMNFVPVHADDAFVIEAGTVHAIGAGVTLLEPQLVRPGRRGLTYRFWDWNRRYRDGKPDRAGEPRQLHRERSMAVTNWGGLSGESFVESCRSSAEPLSGGDFKRARVIDWRWFLTERWQGEGSLDVPATGKLWAVCCTAGELRIETAAGELLLRRGESGIVPACAGALRARSAGCITYATRLPDSEGSLRVRELNDRT